MWRAADAARRGAYDTGASAETPWYTCACRSMLCDLGRSAQQQQQCAIALRGALAAEFAQLSLAATEEVEEARSASSSAFLVEAIRRLRSFLQRCVVCHRLCRSTHVCVGHPTWRSIAMRTEALRARERPGGRDVVPRLRGQLPHVGPGARGDPRPIRLRAWRLRFRVGAWSPMHGRFDADRMSIRARAGGRVGVDPRSIRGRLVAMRGRPGVEAGVDASRR